MADDAHERTPTAEPAAEPIQVRTPVDPLLRFLVAEANRTGIEFPVTLFVGGHLVTGRLISGKKYYEGFAQDVTVSFSGVGAQAIRDAFQAQAESLYPPVPEDESEEAAADRVAMTAFVHLEGAQVVYSDGSTIPTGLGARWRGRLDAVDGFIYGTVEVT